MLAAHSPRAPRFTTLLIAGSLVSNLALALPSIDELFSLRVNQSANSDNFATGDIMVWGASNVTPAATSFGLTGQCPNGSICASILDPNFVRQSLFYRNWTWRPNQYFASRPFNADLSSPWSLLVSSTANFAPGTNTFVDTPSIGNAPLLPFVQSMSASGTGLTPTISWELPQNTPRIDAIRIQIFDQTNTIRVRSANPQFPSSFQQSDLIFEQVLSGSSTSFALPAHWNTPDNQIKSLAFGNQYSINIALEQNRADNTPASRSSSLFDFTPLNLPGIPNIALPSVVPVPTSAGLLADGSVYHFSNTTASPNSVTYIDPLVATGFTYAIGAGDPNFKSVLIPTQYGDGLYDVQVWNGAGWISAKENLGINETFDFTLNGHLSGVDKFRIVGIETSAEVSPLDVAGFVTGLTFMTAGKFNGTMQAIAIDTTAPVPEPETYLMLLSGLGLLGWTAFNRRRIKML